MNRKSIEAEKKKRSEFKKVINTKLWAKWAEKKKKTEVDGSDKLNIREGVECGRTEH